MINFRKIEIDIVTGLQDYITSNNITCPVIMANQTAPTPEYPYISYTVTQPVSSDMKGYSVAKDGTRYKPLGQVWSFTIQSGDDVEAINIAMLAYDWFALIGNTYLNDRGIVAERVGNVTNRDNLLSIEYEYRKGFDVDFVLINEIAKENAETSGYIETVEF